jgi:cytochrome P450
MALLKTLKNNPIECWTQAHFEEPIVIGGFPFGRVAVVSEPATIRKVLVENSANYRKSALQRRILSTHLRDGLVAAEGEQWQRQRRALAPLFGRKMVMRFAPAMASAAAALVERWYRHLEDGPLDIAEEMSRLTHAIAGASTASFHRAGVEHDHRQTAAHPRRQQMSDSEVRANVLAGLE